MKTDCQHFVKKTKMCRYTKYACNHPKNKYHEQLTCYWRAFPPKEEYKGVE